MSLARFDDILFFGGNVSRWRGREQERERKKNKKKRGGGGGEEEQKDE